MARNPIAANLLMVIILAGGLWTAFSIQKEVSPQFQLDVVTVSVTYPGASPAEVEQGILLPIEEAVRGVQGIKEMTSTAREGSGSVSLELVAGTDRMRALQDVDQAVATIRTFPEAAEEPRVRLQARQRSVIEIGLYGEVETWSLRKLGERVRDRMLSDPAITQVAIDNVPDYVTHVTIPQQRLREHDLTLGEVADIIERSSRDIPAGAIDTSEGEVLLRLHERKEWASELAGIQMLTADSGGVVTLGELATVRDGFEEGGFHAHFNQQPSIELEVFRTGQQSPLVIEDAVQGILSELNSTLPPGVSARIDSNRAEDFDDRLSLLLENGALAILIVLAILSLFLEARLAFWIMMGMTLSFVGGLVVLPWIGVSINLISMFGFLVALGIVVDDAIVVGENVYEHRQRGMGALAAAIHGAREMAAPVTFAILTNIVAFLPVMFLPGTTGNYWWPLPAVVITVLAISLAEALFILPAHLAESRGGGATRAGSRLHRLQQAFADWFNRAVARYYRPFLALCLRLRYITLAVAVTLLAVVGGYASSDHMGMILMPEVAADEIEAGVSLPVGTTDEQAAGVAEAVTAATARMFETHDLHRVAEGIKTNVRGQDFIDVEIVMKPPDQRDMRAQAVIELWRDSIGDIEGVDQITFEAERGPGGWRPDINVALSHTEIETLAAASQAFKGRIEAFDNTRDIQDSYRKGKTRFNFQLTPEGRALGLTPGDVGDQVRNAFYGALALRHLRGTNEVEVRVKLPEAQREGMENLENFIVQTDDGTDVPLGEVARMERGTAFATIKRRAGRRVVEVSMDVEPKAATGRLLTALKTEVLPQLRADHPGLTWTFVGSQADLRESTQALWAGFLLALAAIYALLAVAFSSYLQPLLVLLAIPFGIVGGVIGHILLGFDLSLISLMGVVALSGVVINDALIMITYANRQRGEASAHDAILQAGQRRFRPITLTTLTTFGGLTPIILETSRQAAHLIPMAISLGFGIVFATAIILVIVPSLYLILEDVYALTHRAGGGRGSG
ncbi:efflux RND transporter permease subunit [Thiohalorhabdus sp.]|uniref:efflux RND transporter permease subunit n=1 Tax=Thiohalorhabdus sp. TaxID=3094134 RepID=UPI003FCCF76E